MIPSAIPVTRHTVRSESVSRCSCRAAFSQSLTWQKQRFLERESGLVLIFFWKAAERRATPAAKWPPPPPPVHVSRWRDGRPGRPVRMHRGARLLLSMLLVLLSSDLTVRFESDTRTTGAARRSAMTVRSGSMLSSDVCLLVALQVRVRTTRIRHNLSNRNMLHKVGTQVSNALQTGTRVSSRPTPNNRNNSTMHRADLSKSVSCIRVRCHFTDGSRLQQLYDASGRPVMVAAPVQYVQQPQHGQQQQQFVPPQQYQQPAVQNASYGYPGSKGMDPPPPYS